MTSLIVEQRDPVVELSLSITRKFQSVLDGIPLPGGSLHLNKKAALSPQARAAMDKIVSYYKDVGYAPSVDELLDVVKGQKNRSIEALAELEEAGYIEQGRDENGTALSRGIRIIQDLKGKTVKFVPEKVKANPDDLTEKQRACLNAIEDFIAENGFAPTVREIANGMDCAPGSINHYFKILTEGKYIWRTDGIPRALGVNKYSK